MKIDKLANHILGVADQEKILVKNIQLQQVLYFTVKSAANKRYWPLKQIKKMIDRPFFVWRYGPIEPVLYEQYRMYGSDPILNSGQCDPNLVVLNPTIIKLLKQDTFVLIRNAHAEPFWQQHEAAIQGWRSPIKYSFKDIIKRED